MFCRFTLEYPPSVNHYWRRAGDRVVCSAAADAYRDVAIGLTDQMFEDKPVSVWIDLFPLDHRVRDIDNVCKAVLDAIEYAGIIANDANVDNLIVTRGDVSLDTPHVLVTIWDSCSAATFRKELSQILFPPNRGTQ